jgi:hypothetical protein
MGRMNHCSSYERIEDYNNDDDDDNDNKQQRRWRQRDMYRWHEYILRLWWQTQSTLLALRVRSVVEMVGDDTRCTIIAHTWQSTIGEVLIMSMYHNRPGHVYSLGEPFVVPLNWRRPACYDTSSYQQYNKEWMDSYIHLSRKDFAYTFSDKIGRICIWEVSDYSRASSARLIIAMCDSTPSSTQYDNC